MTHPLTNALAMRTAAANLCDREHAGAYWGRAILALPLEADHAALLAEAVNLPEIAALIKASAMAWQGLVGEYGHYKARVNFCELEDALDALSALETP